jgi:hypothetical protein
MQLLKTKIQYEQNQSIIIEPDSHVNALFTAFLIFREKKPLETMFARSFKNVIYSQATL